MVKHLLKSKNPTVAPLVSPTEVTLRITAKGKNAVKTEAMINEMDAKIVGILGDTVFGRDEQTLESVVVKLLIVRKLTLALAESCTGGLISNRITDVTGSSATMLMGVVSYSNESKIEKLGVPKELLEQYGAVSEQVAKAMAEGIRKSAGSDIGVGVTGIAGPEGGTKEKPIGLVYVALANKEGTQVQRHQFIGSRKTIKLRTSQVALNMIRTSIK
jgi:nicotinamide-nucleotide amidase